MTVKAGGMRKRGETMSDELKPKPEKPDLTRTLNLAFEAQLCAQFKRN